MMTYELADLMYFITSFKNSHHHLDITNWVEFSDNATRSCNKCKLVHTFSSSVRSHHLYLTISLISEILYLHLILTFLQLH